MYIILKYFIAKKILSIICTLNKYIFASRGSYFIVDGYWLMSVMIIEVKLAVAIC